MDSATLNQKTPKNPKRWGLDPTEDAGGVLCRSWVMQNQTASDSARNGRAEIQIPDAPQLKYFVNSLV